ncbi:MAG: cob(I)yrinic acid a,c-diamide adenosyltransferase [Dehalococcoidales bacterium]|nr:cob(I)yrinic acid a,c-diamide adenosyltransferase [Dehalococcoidia bacterium]NCG35560.1 cob(I)yrinic acid a,c-diamide adenosyltransferase [Dehalococcoidales bacterium]
MARLYTKNGDEGNTFLLFGQKVSKTDIRVQCYGAIDECISNLGVAYAISNEKNNSEVADLIIKVQRTLFIISSEIACSKEKYLNLKKNYRYLKKEAIDELEKLIDHYQEITPKINYFVLPGGSLFSSFVDIARTNCRKSERLCVEIEKKDLLNNKNILIYLNRLSDLLFIIARYIDKDQEYLKATE